MFEELWNAFNVICLSWNSSDRKTCQQLNSEVSKKFLFKLLLQNTLKQSKILKMRFMSFQNYKSKLKMLLKALKVHKSFWRLVWSFSCYQKLLRF